MYITWTKNIKDSEEKGRFESQVVSAKPVLNRLREILKEKENQLDRSETSLEAYDTPNWAEKQAHKNGFRTCLYQVDKLIDIDSQDKGVILLDQ